MKSKTSSFNKTVFKKDLTRFAPAWGAYFIVLLLVLISMSENGRPYYRVQNVQTAINVTVWANLIYGGVVAQLLLTGSDFSHEDRKNNFQNTMSRLLELGALPIINENDTVATEEIVIGDNDTLAAIVACGVQADLLILLSDIDGLYTADPHRYPEAERIPVVQEITPEICALCGDSGSTLGTGGMATKVRAAKMATEQGIEMVIANGDHPEILYDLFEGSHEIGTRFLAGRKQA